MAYEPLVSIIVLNYNGERWLSSCLESIQAQTYQPIETIVVDNASSDGSMGLVATRFPHARILRLSTNLGYTGANNQAASIATGELLLFLNNDTRVESNAIAKLVAAIDRDGGAGLVLPNITDYENTAKGSCGVGVDKLAYPQAPKDGEPAFYADGAALFIRREVFDQLGRFDDDYFIFAEDVDLSWRARLSGYAIAAASSAIVCHYGGGVVTGGHLQGKRFSTTPWRRYMGERNRLTNLLKNYEADTLAWILPCYIAVTGAAMVALAAAGRWELALAYPRAYRWNVRQLARTLRKRAAVQSQRVVPDAEIMRQMLKGSVEFALLRSHGLPRLAAG